MTQAQLLAQYISVISYVALGLAQPLVLSNSCVAAQDGVSARSNPASGRI